MAIIKCPECGHQVSDKAATCPSCGVEIAGKVMRCPECGAIVFKNQEVCPDCHYPLHDTSSTATTSTSEDSDITSVTDPTPEAVVTYEPEPQDVVVPVSPTTSNGAESTENAMPNGKQPRKKSYIMIVVCVVIVLIVAFVGFYVYKNSQTNAEADAYETAITSDEPGVLQNYLDIYKDAPEDHKSAIMARLDQLMQADKEWTDAVVSGSKQALERYLQMHPGTPHEREAKMKIDSLDWLVATQANTTDAYQTYMDTHSDGMYIDDAKERFNELDAKKVSSEDRQNVSLLFGNFFRSLGAGDEDGLTATVSTVMDKFLNRVDATKNDVISYMHKVHADADGSAVSFRTNNDWKIQKQPSADGNGYEYTVTFTVDQKSGAQEGAAIVSYKVSAKVSSEGKISSLTMQKMVE